MTEPAPGTSRVLEKIAASLRDAGYEATLQRFPEEMERLEGLFHLLKHLDELLLPLDTLEKP